MFATGDPGILTQANSCDDRTDGFDRGHAAKNGVEPY